METNKTVILQNRSRSTVVYKLDNPPVRRQFAPGQSYKISMEELEALSYRPGGDTMLRNYLVIKNDPDQIKETIGEVEPEYFLDKEGVIELLKNGSVDQLLDCLDFAPQGVIELVKQQAIDLPVFDARKRKAIKDKTGLDVDMALVHIQQAAEDDDEIVSDEPKQRRVSTTQATNGRRSTPNYKVVTPKGE